MQYAFMYCLHEKDTIQVHTVLYYISYNLTILHCNFMPLKSYASPDQKHYLDTFVFLQPVNFRAHVKHTLIHVLTVSSLYVDNVILIMFYFSDPTGGINSMLNAAWYNI